ncbi:15013_t:CDS:2, partial [Racocetra fulgida]
MAWRSVKKLGNIFNDARSSSKIVKSQNTAISSRDSLTNDNNPVSSSNIQDAAYSTRSSLTDIHSELRDASELLYLQLPEDVKLVLDRVRNLQRAENSVLFYDKKLPNGECQALSVIHENVECHYVGRSDQPPHSRHHTRLSHHSNSTFHSESESSESSSKNSSLVKVLGASSLLTKIVRSILSHHHDVLMNSFTDSTTLDNFHLLCEQVSKEAKELAKQIKKITNQGKTDELVEYEAKQSINDLNVTADSSDHLSGHSTVSFEREQSLLSHKFNISSSASSWRSQNESTDTDLSITSAVTMPLMYTKERKFTSSETTSLHESRSRNPISPLSNNRLYRNNMDLFIDTKNDPSFFYSAPNTPNTLNSNCNISLNHRNRNSYLRFNNEPVSPALSDSSKGSKFKEMLDESSFKTSLGFNIDQDTKKNRTRTQSFITRFMSNGRLSKNLTDSERENQPRPRRVSNPSTKSHFFKHLHLPSRKGKVSENTARTTSYWPVTEDPNKSPSRFFRTPSLSGK